MSVLHIRTPLTKSERMTAILDKQAHPVYLKLDNLQPSGSFKIRGIGATCADAKINRGSTKIVGSSGGNAGMAMAYAARKLSMSAQLYIPTSTPHFMVEKIKEEGASVVVGGSNWNEANQAASECLEKDPKAAFIHPYDQDTTWQGHSTIIDEIKAQLKETGISHEPAAIVTVVGGGGLAAGILMGMERVGWSGVPLMAMETQGADCFNAAIKEGQIVRLDRIRSVATSLGALSVLPKLFEMKQSGKFDIRSGLVTDEEAIEATIKFAQHHRMMVEPACGAALAAVYSRDSTSNPLMDMVKKSQSHGPIVIIVCGGNIATLDSMVELRAKLKSDQS